jgi:hypothetical protein
MKRATPWIVLLVVLGGGAAWYFSQQEAPDEHPSVVTLPVQETVTPPPEANYPVEDVPLTEEPAPEPLPSLADSDPSMIEALAGLLGPESLGSYFVLEQMINRIVATVDSLDSRQLAPLVMPVKPAAGKFLVTENATLGIDPENAQRYAPFVSMASALDTQQMAGIYVRFYPLFQQAYADLGHGDVYFNDRLVEVIDHLLAVPEPAGELVLVKPEAVYLFEDPDLEALSAGRKLLLRIGPSNAAVILDKLREIRTAVAQP